MKFFAQATCSALHPEDHPRDKTHCDKRGSAGEELLASLGEFSRGKCQEATGGKTDSERTCNANPYRSEVISISNFDDVRNQDSNNESRFKTLSDSNKEIAQHRRANPSFGERSGSVSTVGSSLNADPHLRNYCVA